MTTRPLLHVADGATPDVGARETSCMLIALCAGGHAVAQKESCRASAFLDRGEHADVVGLRAIHALRRARNAAEDVAAAHNDGELDTVVHDFRDFVGPGRRPPSDRFRNPNRRRARLAGKLQSTRLYWYSLAIETPFSAFDLTISNHLTRIDSQLEPRSRNCTPFPSPQTKKAAWD